MTCAANVVVVCKVRTQLTLYMREIGERTTGTGVRNTERSRCSGFPEKGKIKEERRTERQLKSKCICKACVKCYAVSWWKKWWKVGNKGFCAFVKKMHVNSYYYYSIENGKFKKNILLQPK